MTSNTLEADLIRLQGTISCKAALETDRFGCECLMADPKKRSRDIGYIISLAKRQGIAVQETSKTILDMYGKGHGGIMLEVLPKALPDIHSVKAPAGLAVYLDGVEDPYNLGSCIRTLYAAGASLIILPRRNWNTSLPVLMKASAGAFARASIVMTESEESLLEWARMKSLPIYCAARSDQSVSSFQLQWPDSLLLIIGGALRGISSRILSECDVQVHIPYGREFRNALDTPSAAAVLGFEWLRSNQNSTETAGQTEVQQENS